MAENINDLIERTPRGGTAMLPSGEFEGPVYITKPLHLVGKNTTLWAKRGSIIEITSPSVTIEGLRVELTEDDVHNPAIKARVPADVRDVEVFGGVQGFGGEDGYFDIPRTLDLGAFAADAENTYLMTINVPVAADIECSTQGVEFSPKHIPAGRSEVTVAVSGIGTQMFLYAEVLLKTRFTRRIYITGRPRTDVPRAEMLRIFTAPERGAEEHISAGTQNNVHSVAAYTDIVSVPQSAPACDMPLLEMKRGQRVALYQYVGNKCTVSFSCTKPQDIDIDPYLFMLDGNERSFGDSGLIFFGNETSEHGEVKYFPADGHLEIDLEKIDYRVQKMTIAYSVYAGDRSKNFSRVRAPRISISADGRERIAFVMDGLADETTVVAVEIYRYKGEWKLSAVGSGYRDGMALMCNRYGIEVE